MKADRKTEWKNNKNKGNEKATREKAKREEKRRQKQKRALMQNRKKAKENGIGQKKNVRRFMKYFFFHLLIIIIPVPENEPANTSLQQGCDRHKWLLPLR